MEIIRFITYGASNLSYGKHGNRITSPHFLGVLYYSVIGNTPTAEDGDANPQFIQGHITGDDCIGGELASPITGFR
jgi:hypothetical protein